jgi:integrase
MVPTLRAMVELQRLAGLRPGEVRHLTPVDLDTTGELWVYAPAEHKMAHLGRDKAVPLPPSARALLEPWLADRGPGEVVFSPRRAREEMYAEQRARRKSKVTPSQQCRRKPAEQLAKTWPARFTGFGYAAWVRRACVRAGVKPWKPGQLRHSFATEVRSRFGLEAAQVLLGHKRADVTQVYAEATLAKADEAARALG